MATQPIKPEPEHEGSIWTHPYLLYILLTAALFLGLVFFGWLAYENGWVPSR
jgi:hypothetical protein